MSGSPAAGTTARTTWQMVARIRRGRNRAVAGLLLAAALVVSGGNVGRAQTPAPPPTSATIPATPQSTGGQDGAGASSDGALPGRSLLEQRVRQRLEQIVQRQLQLTDAQMQRLRQTNARFSAERRTMADRERQLRGALRQELLPGVAANQSHVAALADSLFSIQRQRLDATEAEQKEMSGYLTPVQRVRYYGLQDQFRRRLEQIRDRRPGATIGNSIAP